MGRNRRSKSAILAEVLESCVVQPRTQTWLLRKVGLTTAIIQRVVKFLVHADLLLESNNLATGNIEYRTTVKGKEALAQYLLLMTKFFKGLHQPTAQ